MNKWKEGKLACILGMRVREIVEDVLQDDCSTSEYVPRGGLSRDAHAEEMAAIMGCGAKRSRKASKPKRFQLRLPLGRPLSSDHAVRRVTQGQGVKT